MSLVRVVKAVTPGEYSGRYCAQVYFTVKSLQDHHYYCHFVVTKDLEMCLAVVKRKFQKEYDIAVPITFGDDHIVLDIPDNGTCTESGWEIVPLHNARIEKDRVDNFSSECTWVPECVLLLKWLLKDKTPEPLEYKLRLLGTRDGWPFFRIYLNPGHSPTLQSAVVQSSYPHLHFLQQTYSAHHEMRKAALFAHENQQVITAKFGAFQTKVCNKLLTYGVDTEQFQQFVKNQFPPGDCIPQHPTSLTETFGAITHHRLWDYFHYSPLVHIVQTFGANDYEMMDWVQTYKNDLKAYSIVATLDDYFEADCDHPVADVPPAKRAKYEPHYYHPVEWGSTMIDHTLQYLNEVWNVFSSHYLDLPDFLPTALVDRVCMALGQKITKEPVVTQQKETPPSKALLGPDTEVSLPTVSEALEESKLVQRMPVAAEPPIFSVGPIRGVEVIGMTEFTVPTHGINFEWEGYGLKLSIPDESLPGGVGECRVNIRVSLSGQFQLPEDSDLLSPVFWISAPCKFTKPVTLEIQHCALREDERVLSDLSFVSAMCSQRDLPYRFKQLDGGVFTMHSFYGSIQLNHLSGKGVIGRKTTPRLYCARLYHTIEQIYDWRFCLVITQDLPVFNTVVKNHCREVGAKLDDISLEVEFLKDEITLDFPEGMSKEGWEITPRSRPVITKRKVDMFEKGQSIPQCQLMMVWKGHGTPVRLEYKIVLKETRPSNENFLLLVLDPAEVQDSPSGSKQHPTIPDKPELKDLTGALNKVASEWKRLGVNLEIPEGTLNNIAADYPHKSEDCLLEMLKEWLKRQDAPPSWATIVDAVESLGYKQLGSELKEKYRIP